MKYTICLKFTIISWSEYNRGDRMRYLSFFFSHSTSCSQCFRKQMTVKTSSWLCICRVNYRNGLIRSIICSKKCHVKIPSRKICFFVHWRKNNIISPDKLRIVIPLTHSLRCHFVWQVTILYLVPMRENLRHVRLHIKIPQWVGESC